MMCGCNKCTKMTGAIWLIVGVLFLLVDFGVWEFWNIEWWTIVFIFMGLTTFCMSSCKDCQAMLKKK